MKHPREEDLILHYYGEGDTADTSRHLESCTGCREAFERLDRDLRPFETLEVPARPADYGERVWRRVSARLDAPAAPRRAGWFAWPRLVLAGATAALFLGVFWAGYGAGRRAEPIPGPVRERILLIAVGQHLERTQRLLVELTHAGGAPATDATAWRATADRLAGSNRLYRQTAAKAGDETVAAVLEELERLLIEIANGPDSLAQAELTGLQRRIERQGILFKIRVIGEGARQRGAMTPPPQA